MKATTVCLFTVLILNLNTSPLLIRGQSDVQEDVVDEKEEEEVKTVTANSSHHHHLHHEDSHNTSNDSAPGAGNGNSDEESKISEDPSSTSSTTLLSLSIVANVFLIVALIAAFIYFRMKIQTLESPGVEIPDLSDDFSTSPVGEKEEHNNVGAELKVKGNREEVGYEIAKV